MFLPIFHTIDLERCTDLVDPAVGSFFLTWDSRWYEYGHTYWGTCTRYVALKRVSLILDSSNRKVTGVWIPVL